MVEEVDLVVCCRDLRRSFALDYMAKMTVNQPFAPASLQDTVTVLVETHTVDSYRSGAGNNSPRKNIVVLYTYRHANNDNDSSNNDNNKAQPKIDGGKEMESGSSAKCCTPPPAIT